jgi:superfamily I DNA/RNA helicase
MPSLKYIVDATHPNGQSPNTGQQTAVESIAGLVLVVAGPGSGKTKTLITSTLNLILNYEVSMKNMKDLIS